MIAVRVELTPAFWEEASEARIAAVVAHLICAEQVVSLEVHRHCLFAYLTPAQDEDRVAQVKARAQTIRARLNDVLAGRPTTPPTRHSIEAPRFAPLPPPPDLSWGPADPDEPTQPAIPRRTTQSYRR